ncbi:MAG: tyrosine-type recombinase/integrase [Deltaproteobacteria bacterium]|nr:tyrosine-type recombinase/integrase [Deltaproteobacteria bacterium]
MGLLVECPKCHRRNSPKARTCRSEGCGFNLSKYSGRVYWIEWYNLDGERERKRIGPNKEAAEQELRSKLSAKAEGRHIKKSPDAKTRFKALAEWYIKLPEVKAKHSYKRDEQTLKRLQPYLGERLLKDITPATVEAYRQKRLSEPSGRSPKNLTCPATVNREIACLKTIFNKAIKDGRAEHNPCQGVRMLKENNERDRVLSLEEYARLLAHCPAHLKPVVKLAYHTGMRQGEILSLTWGEVDLRGGFIHLRPEHCKTKEGRAIPLSREMVDMLKALRQGLPLPQVQVFTYAGRCSVGSIKRAFVSAVKKAGIEDFTFHDLRHTAINNWRLQGHDYFRIMAATGHKTLSVFKRYNTVSKEELKALVGGSRQGEKTGSDRHLYGHHENLDTKQEAVSH